MRKILASAAVIALITGAAHAAPPEGDQASIAHEIEAALGGDYDVSAAALDTAVRGENGTPVGIAAYNAPIDAVKAGDMAAFIAMVATADDEDEALSGFSGVILGVDKIAGGELEAARTVLEDSRGAEYTDPIIDFVDAWIYALDGDIDAAIRAHRDADTYLPGLTGDLSLAAMLEAAGRPEEALFVYEAMTPARIEAPEHMFDAKGIMFAHVQMVIARRTLLLRRLGRIEEAKGVYRTLAEAEPEQAARYAAAMESLETGRGLDDEVLTMDAAFGRALSDLSLSLWQQRIIRNAMMGQRSRGLDEQRATFDQLALLVDPTNDGLRENVIDMLLSEALYEGAAHVARTAPEPTASLHLSAAQSLLWARENDSVRTSISDALEIADEDERLGIVAGAVGLHALLGDETRAIDLATEAISLARNDAERAMTAALKSEILEQFGRVEESVPFARQARDIDDTHGRRMYLANILGEAGEVEEGLQLIRLERLKRPNDPYMLNTLGYFLVIHTDKFEEGFRVLHRANALARNDPYIADSLGWAYFKLGHMEDARRLIEQSRRELAPRKHWEIEHHLGDIYWYLGREDDAREAWQTALDEFPPYLTAQEIRGKLENGLTQPRPEEKPVPRISLDDAETLQRDT